MKGNVVYTAMGLASRLRYESVKAISGSSPSDICIGKHITDAAASDTEKGRAGKTSKESENKMSSCTYLVRRESSD